MVETEKYILFKAKSTCPQMDSSLVETRIIGRHRVREWKNEVKLLNVVSGFVHLNHGPSFGAYHVPKR